MQPFYIFSSGGLQFADISLLFLLLYLILLITLDKSKKFFLKSDQFYQIIVMFLVFISWTIIVNGLLSMNEANFYMKGSLYLFFNLLAVITVYLYYLINPKNIISDALIGVKISVVLQFIISFFVLTIGTRQAIFFNNPNQLGYYGLLVITFLLLFSKTKKRYIYVLLAFYLVLLSNSSSAIIGSIIVMFISILLLNVNKVKKIFTISTLILLSSFVYLNIERLYRFEVISNTLSRFENKNESVDLVSGRGYGRVFELKYNFLWGVGEGVNERFIHLSGSELHSTFVGILVSYGLRGLLLFIFLLYKFYMFSIIKSQAKNLMFIGIIFYWFTHQGVRNTLFWMLISIYTIYILKNNSISKEKRLL